jgi:hypothetical protein
MPEKILDIAFQRLDGDLGHRAEKLCRNAAKLNDV